MSGSNGLVLTRRADEGLTMFLPDGTTIVVQVHRVKGGSVRLQVKADDSIKIVRNELTKLDDPKELEVA